MQEFRRLNKVKDRILQEDKVRESKGDYGAVREAKMIAVLKREQFTSFEEHKQRRKKT